MNDNVNKELVSEAMAIMDYKKDGLLHCGNCHTPKEFYYRRTNEVLQCKCDCEKAVERERQWQELHRERREVTRKRTLPREKMWACTFSNAEISETIQISQKYVAKWGEMKETGTGLVFCGNVGTGKSYAALCIANALIDRDETVRYTAAADLLAEFTARNVNQVEYIAEEICTPSILIIDDLGAEHDSNFSQSQMCRLIDARRETGKPFIVTTNYSLEEMESPADQVRQRIFDRVLGSCVPVIVTGKSRRQTEGQTRLEMARKLLSQAE